MTPLTTLALSFALAFIAESFVEYIFGQAVDHVPALAPFRWLLMYVALLAGVGLTYAYEIDLLWIIAPNEVTRTWLGIVLSGLVIGRGANFLHDFVSRYIKPGGGQG